MVLLLTIVENRKMSPVTAIAPTNAAKSMAMKPEKEYVQADRLPPIANMTMATPSAAPLFMPNTSGPASGLRNTVWSIRPVTANAAPHSAAVRA